MPETRLSSWTRSLPLAVCLGVLPALGLPSPAHAQEGAKPRPKDDALEGLLKEIKQARPDAPKPDAPKADPKPAADAKPKSSEPPKANDPAKGQSKPDEVAPKDKGLDSLLEKLGETRDKPAEEERGGGGPPNPDEKKGQGGQGQDKDKPKVDPLTGKQKVLDEHLEELTGKTRKKDRSKGEDGGGPLGEVIKEMRDVEQRLGKTDTGEETRKKQQQIVKNLETLIEQMKSSSPQSKRQQRQLAMKQGGQRPGQNPGQTPGTTGGNAPNTKPADPNKKRSLAGGKDEWGHLPPELRQELENVFKEEFLPSREELIRRYYQAVNKKSLTRGE